MPVNKKNPQVEVGDLFVTATEVTIKLLPSKKSGSHRISWFEGGAVTNARAAAKDIAYLVGKLQGKNRVVRALTVMTDLGVECDLTRTGLVEVVKKAGYAVLK